MGISTTGDGVNYYVTITYLPTYYTTAAQETELTAAVNSLKSELNLDGKTDYEKVKAIYDYMTANISYDYENLNDPDYTLKYTAYAALLNKTSVCQGYAALFYRMACEYGIDARMISGKSLNNIGQKENHGWNIVKLGDKYYNLDATWDSTWDSDKTTHDFFLKSNDSFENHERNTEFTTSGFNAAHPMSGTDYVPGTDSVPHEHNYGEWIIDKNATCTTAGFKHKECINCDVELVEEIPALEHKLVKHTGKAATCTAKGWKAYEKCSRCDYTTYTAIAAKGHKWESFYTIDKKATTKAAGSKSKHCATCNAAKSGSKVTISRIKKTTADTLVYNGKNRTQNVTVVNYAGKKLVKGTDFTVTYKNAKGTKVVTPKNVGTYKAVIKFKGMYSGTVTKTFKINPQETKIAKLTKNGKNQFTVKWTKKTAQVTGYQIKYSMKQNMSNAKTETVKNAKTTSKTIKQLKAKKKYYVQIRTYKTVNGTKYYSAWSAKSYVTTK